MKGEAIRQPSRFWAGVNLLLGFVLLGALGTMLLNNGMEALAAGGILVHPRRAPPMLISAAAAPWRFGFEVWGRIVAGAFLVLVAAALPVAFLLASPERRRRMLDDAARSSRLRRGPRVPGWLAFLIIAVAFAAFIMASGRFV